LWLVDKPLSGKSSLRSSLFRFLLAGESESHGKVAQTYGARAKKNPRATPACLKGNGKDCYASYIIHYTVRIRYIRVALIQLVYEKFCTSPAAAKRMFLAPNKFKLLPLLTKEN